MLRWTLLLNIALVYIYTRIPPSFRCLSCHVSHNFFPLNADVTIKYILLALRLVLLSPLTSFPSLCDLLNLPFPSIRIYSLWRLNNTAFFLFYMALSTKQYIEIMCRLILCLCRDIHCFSTEERDLGETNEVLGVSECQWRICVPSGLY